MKYSDIVILNFDLGVRGDYESLYTFLDNNKALDCGNSNSVFEYHFRGTNLTYKDKFDQLEMDLEKIVKFERNDRIYAIVHNNEGVPQGKFLFGKRKTPVWDGYGEREEDESLPF